MNVFQILLGSNSDADKHMALAMKRLHEAFPEDIRFSAILKSAEVSECGGEAFESAAYLNAICLAHTELAMEHILSTLKTMETDMGRKRNLEAKGVVAIDLDLVVWNGVVLRPKDVAQAYYQNCLKSLKSSF